MLRLPPPPHNDAAFGALEAWLLTRERPIKSGGEVKVSVIPAHKKLLAALRSARGASRAVVGLDAIVEELATTPALEAQARPPDKFFTRLIIFDRNGAGLDRLEQTLRDFAETTWAFATDEQTAREAAMITDWKDMQELLAAMAVVVDGLQATGLERALRRLRSPRLRDRVEAADSVAAFGPEAACAARLLTSLFSDNDSWEGGSSAFGLLDVDPCRDFPLCQAAIRALVAIGLPAVPMVLEVLRHRHFDHAQYFAALVAGELGIQEAVPILERLVADAAVEHVSINFDQRITYRIHEAAAVALVRLRPEPRSSK